MKDSLGDRMKEFYEDRSRIYLLKKTPVIVRVDGRAFHTLTKRAAKPFDDGLITAMGVAAMHLASEMQGFKAGYVQSDEASFLLMDTDTINTEAWFDNNLQKLVSISSSTMTVAFNRSEAYQKYAERVGVKSAFPLFDARAFNIPPQEVANYFLWRAKDWERNSISMFARSFYSHKELNGLGHKAILAKLEADGHRWEDLPSLYKNGSWIQRMEGRIAWGNDVQASYKDMHDWLEPIMCGD